jgi:mannose-1-phosphate guanylyltransferase
LRVKPVVVLGLSNAVVAVSRDGILVTDKSASPRIRDIVNFNQGPMYEERQWGGCKILDIQNYPDSQTRSQAVVNDGQSHCGQQRRKKNERTQERKSETALKGETL